MRSYLLPGILLFADIITVVVVAFIGLFIRFDGYIEPQYIYQMVGGVTTLNSCIYLNVFSDAFVYPHLAICRHA